MPVRPYHSRKTGDLLGYQAIVQDKSRGIKRTKRNFPISQAGTAKQAKTNAKEWETAVYSDAQRRLLGGRRRRLFGETLTEYYTANQAQLSQDDAAHKRLLSNIKNLRFPVYNEETRSWLRLEELPIEKQHPDELDIIDGLKSYATDQKQIIKRSRYKKEIYQLRPTSKGAQWYWQPAPEDEPRPPIRQLIKDPELLETLSNLKGRGPIAPDTLRVRQALVSTVLKWAYLERKTEHDQSSLVKRESGGEREVAIITYDQLLTMLIHLSEGVDLAVLAANFLGWRKANILGLTWDRVNFPAVKSREIIEPGYAWVKAGHHDDPGQRTKKKRKLIHAMTPFTEQIFRVAWMQKHGDYVFHNSKGKKIGDIRKTFESAKKAAGITGPLTPWHGWRHNFNTRLGQSRATPHEMMGLAGWSSVNMTTRYMHDTEVHQASAYSAVLEDSIKRFKGE